MAEAAGVDQTAVVISNIVDARSASSIKVDVTVKTTSAMLANTISSNLSEEKLNTKLKGNGLEEASVLTPASVHTISSQSAATSPAPPAAQDNSQSKTVSDSSAMIGAIVGALGAVCVVTTFCGRKLAAQKKPQQQVLPVTESNDDAPKVALPEMRHEKDEPVPPSLPEVRHQVDKRHRNSAVAHKHDSASSRPLFKQDSGDDLGGDLARYGGDSPVATRAGISTKRILPNAHDRISKMKGSGLQTLRGEDRTLVQPSLVLPGARAPAHAPQELAPIQPQQRLSSFSNPLPPRKPPSLEPRAPTQGYAPP